MAYTPTINRVSGMSSGMDTESLVRAMTMHQQSKIDMLLRKKTIAEWKSEALTERNNMLRAFKDDFVSLLGSKSLMKADAYNTYSVKNTNNAFSVTTSAAAKAGLYKIQIQQLATGAKAVGAKFANEGYKIATNATLKALMDDNTARATSGGDTVHLTDSGGNYLYDDEGNPVMGFKFSINGQDFQFRENARLSDVLSTINGSKAGVKIAYTELSNSFTIESSATGKSSKLTVREDDSGFFAMLGLDGQNGAGNVFDADSLGEEAIVFINGQEYRNQSNTFTVDGMTFTLSDTTKVGETLEFVIERDTSKSVDLIKSFVESLNELMSKLNTDVRQKKNAKYSPLTEMLKEGMSEKEVELWENKAKEGLFHRDNRMTSLLNSIRGAFTETLGNSGLREIGIKFDTYAPGAAPKLVIDEEKLVKALEADPEKVYNLMAETPKGADQGGVLHRVGAAIDKYTADTKSHDIQNLRDNVNDYVKRISLQEDKLYIMQERLYVKFAAFEKSLGSMQTQSSKISAYFG